MSAQNKRTTNINKILFLFAILLTIIYFIFKCLEM